MKKFKNILKIIKILFLLKNKFFSSRDMMHSFYLSLNKAEQDVMTCYSDIYFKPDLIKKIIKFKNKKKIFLYQF